MLLAIGGGAHAASSLWQINEIYSNADGSVQFIELITASSGQQFVTGQAMTSSQGAATYTLNVTTDLPGDSANKTFLIGTQGFAALNIVAPDYVVPNGFLFTGGGTLNWGGGTDIVSYASLPTDGKLSIDRAGATAINSPTNFAGVTGTIRKMRFDFDGDGKDDILWRNSATGENYIYFMNGTAVRTGGFLRTVADLNWTIAGVGDFDGNGKADILWRNSATGENYIYLMNGTAIAGEGFIRTVADQSWQVAGIGDFDGDGEDDILWRNRDGGLSEAGGGLELEGRGRGGLRRRWQSRHSLEELQHRGELPLPDERHHDPRDRGLPPHGGRPELAGGSARRLQRRR